MREIVRRTVVVGSGCAGLNAADTLASLGEESLLLVTEDMNAGTSRNTGSDKQTYYKLSMAGDEGDSIGALAHYLCGPDVNGDTALCEAAASAPSFFKLCALGVPFPTNEYGEYVGYQTDHDTRRRATSAGPLTSKYMTEALEKSVLARKVHILNHALAARIVKNDQGVAALDVYLTEEKEFLRIRCANIVLCTGGPAHIYLDRVYPESQHGMSGLAFSADAEGANLDCWQYGLASVSFRWNVSGSYQQALPRYVSVDENGVERDFLSDALGDRQAMTFTFLKGYQWPYDESKVPGSSQVDILVKQENDLGHRVYLDYMHNPRGYSEESLSPEALSYLKSCDALKDTPIERLRAMNEPAIALYFSHGIRLDEAPLEIRVCAQHHNGGIAVDMNWQTRVPGLYVCGEAAGTFGRKRPGGSALNSTQAGSLRAARHIMKNGRFVSASPMPEESWRLPEERPHTAAYYQERMTRYAAFLRDEGTMEKLFSEISSALDNVSTTGSKDKDLISRLLLRDILITQREVLSAMLYAKGEPETPPGVLMTRNGVSRREPARPLPERDLWFERVWKHYREEQAHGCDGEAAD
ncbi:MAG: FAD-binding protein [Clostridia bacterium]|nr:FAD-binding protein [Clostridia bacterium]